MIQLELDWKTIKELKDRGYKLRHVELSDRYLVVATDSGIAGVCYIQKGNSGACKDFEENYKQQTSSAASSDVTTRMEVDYLTLKLARMGGQADQNGDLSLTLTTPGDIGAPSRYIAGGYAVTNNYAFGDAVTAIEVCDDANGTYSGYPGAVLRTYHDQDVPSENQGWFFWKSHGTEGEVEMEPVGYYGELYGGMVLKVTFKVQPNAKVNALLWWGSKE